MTRRKGHLPTYAARIAIAASFTACSHLQTHAAPALNQPDSTSTQLDNLEVVGKSTARELTSTTPLHTLDSEDLRRQGISDIGDALRRLPGLNVRDYGGAGGMKTVSLRGLGANHTGVIYDGITLSDCQGGRIDLSRYSISTLGSIGVLEGDNNDLLTSARVAAAAGNIILNTQPLPSQTDRAPHLNFIAETGSFGLVRPYIRYAQTYSSKLTLGLTAEYTHADNRYPYILDNGILTAKEYRRNSRMDSGHTDLNAIIRPDSRCDIEAKGYYYESHREIPGQVILYNPRCNQKLKEKNFFGQIIYTDRHSGPVTLQFATKFNFDNSDFRDKDDKYPGGLWREYYYQREAYASVVALWNIDYHWSVSYAGDYAYNNLNSNLLGDIKPERHTYLQAFSGRFINSWLTATAKLLWSIYDNKVVNDASAKDANRLSPSISLSARPLRDTRFYIRLSYKNIFRMPTFNDNYYYRSGSRELKPEDTESLNIGLTWGADPIGILSSLQVTADMYWNTIRNKIVAIPQNAFQWTMVNLDKARAYGADFTLSATLSLAANQALSCAGNYSLQRVQPRTSPSRPDYNKQVAYTPIHSGAASLSWENPWVNLTLTVSGASERFGTNSNLPMSRLKPYSEIGATLSRNVIIKKITLYFETGLQNIFNTQYEIVSHYPMPGRRWNCKIGIEF
ncbi:MAG: TonB-dependent receptor plug domain-containing protein [Muribaculaceae bacterium]|nr:TonB-dependent receptor plug domain-containing protein [Muribaculaceae bacterium]